MTNGLEAIKESLFEDIKHINEHGQEYWEARELQSVLGYKKWEKFFNIIEKAMNACEASGNNVSEQFPQVGKTIAIPILQGIAKSSMSHSAFCRHRQNGSYAQG